MEDTQERSAWGELKSSIKYCMESISGKYSLDTYLDIIGEYTDRQIIEAEENGLIYLGGECEVLNSGVTDSYDFSVQMYFANNSGEKIAKEAKRKLPKNKFVSKTAQEVGAKIKFEIQSPKKGEKA